MKKLTLCILILVGCFTANAQLVVAGKRSVNLTNEQRSYLLTKFKDAGLRRLIIENQTVRNCDAADVILATLDARK